MELFYKLFPFLLSLLGIFLVYFIYYLYNNFFYRLIFNKFFYSIYIFFSKAWYFNILYNYFLGEPSLKFSFNTSYILLDKGFLEFFGPLGINRFFLSINSILEVVNSGKYYSYILTMLYFVVFFVMFYITFFFLI